MPIIIKKNFNFSFDPAACTECHGYCCRGKSGRVWVTDIDIREISNFLGVNVIDFLQQHVERSNNRLSLKERYKEGSYHCVFYDDQMQGCSVHAVRPDQCRRFPFWEYYKDEKHGTEVLKDCPGARIISKGSG